MMVVEEEEEEEEEECKMAQKKGYSTMFHSLLAH